MSRVGKKVINIPAKVEVQISAGLVVAKGPKGELQQVLHPWITVTTQDKQLFVTVEHPDTKDAKALWGTSRQLINNIIVGVSEGFEKKLEINGVGFKAQSSGQKLTLNVGYSHVVDFVAPAGITLLVEKNIITISGIDKQLVGETAAQIRKVKKPEPYKGKGIKYLEEVIKRKAGKQGKAAA
ncbi:MAG TPA: 50S ribosomal protein L6 [bacterium]|nr:50S ribosomal protein L6 [bacterium]